MGSSIDSRVRSRLIRRTATVTISAPDSRWAFLICWKDEYFPVPMIRREVKVRPPRTKGSEAVPAAGLSRETSVATRRSCRFGRAPSRNEDVVDQPGLPDPHGRDERGSGPGDPDGRHRFRIDRFDVIGRETCSLELPPDALRQGRRIAFSPGGPVAALEERSGKCAGGPAGVR